MSIEYNTRQSQVCMTHSFNETYTSRDHVFSLFHFTTWMTSLWNHCGWCNYLNTRCAVMIVSKTVSTIQWCLFCLCQCHHVCNDTDYITTIWIWNRWIHCLRQLAWLYHSMRIQLEHALQTECLPNSESDFMDALTDVDKALDSIQWLS